MIKNYNIILFLFITNTVFSLDENLLKVDSYRMFETTGFSFDFYLEESNGGEKSDYTMKVYVKDSSSDYAVCKYTSPEKMKGRVILVDGKNFWYLDRGMKSPIRISSRQMLFGQASAGDITRIIFSNYYNVISKSTVDQKLRLDLKSIKNKGAVYTRIVLFVEPHTFKPVMAECYAKSGKLLKKIEYTGFDMYKGKEVLSEMLISSTDGKSVSRVSLLNFSSDRLDDRYFNKAQISRIP